jgi:hypothetical protein
MAGSDDVPGAGIEHSMLVPAPDVDLLGYCTLCGEPEDLHIGPDGEVSVRAFHRSALGGHAKFIDEVEGGA